MARRQQVLKILNGEVGVRKMVSMRKEEDGEVGISHMLTYLGGRLNPISLVALVSKSSLVMIQ